MRYLEMQINKFQGAFFNKKGFYDMKKMSFSNSKENFNHLFLTYKFFEVCK